MFYVPHFLTSSFGNDAPVLDLRLYKDLTEYQAVDESLSVEALPTLERHFWYVTPGIVLFRLFSEKLSVSKFGLPDCPSLTVNTEFWDLVSEESWMFFYIVNLPSDWLLLPPALWESDENFRKTFVRTVKEVNDSVNASDYAKSLTKDHMMIQKIFQAV